MGVDDSGMLLFYLLDDKVQWFSKKLYSNHRPAHEFLEPYAIKLFLDKIKLFIQQYLISVKDNGNEYNTIEHSIKYV